MLSSIWEFACIEAKNRFSEDVSECDSRLEEMQYKVDLTNDQLEVAIRQRDRALDNDMIKLADSECRKHLAKLEK